MNSRRSFYFALVIFIALFSCSSSLGNVNLKGLEGQCHRAAMGDMALSSTDKLSAEESSYLLACSLAPAILEADANNDEVTKVNFAKQTLSDSLIQRELNVHFKDEHGANLIALVVFSYQPEVWKVRTIKKLIELGVNPNQAIENGGTPFDFAKSQQDEKVVELLKHYQ